jgi:hypothetical protein
MRPSLRQVLFRSAATGLDLNFAGGAFSLNNTRTASPAAIPGWSFSRTDTNGTATALDLAGNVIQFATGAPRITNRGILVEEARTNVLLRSNEFDNASWTATNSTVTANAGSAPDGTTTADKIIATVASAQHRADQTAVNSAGTACFSVFLKAAEYSFATIRIGTSGGIVDLSNGSVSGVSVGYTMTATAFPNGWYRCALVGSAALNDTVRINVQNATGFALSFAGDGTSGILAWGAQFELGAFATSPIITTGAAGTRGADSALVNSLPALPTAFTMVAEWSREGGTDAATSYRVASLSRVADDSYSEIYQRHTNNVVRAFQRTLGANQADVTLGTGSIGAVQRAAARFVTNDVTGSFNGAAVVSDTVVTMPASPPLSFAVGSTNGTSGWLNGYIRRVQVLPFAATDAQLQALTAP